MTRPRFSHHFVEVEDELVRIFGYAIERQVFVNDNLAHLATS